MLEKLEGECEEGSKTILRNREGESGREMRDMVQESRMQEKEKRKRKKDSCWQVCFKKERWPRKVGARRGNGQERGSDIVPHCEKGKDLNGRDGAVPVEEAKNKAGNRNQNETDNPNSEQERDG